MDNVFVLGLDEHNARILGELPDAHNYRFHALLEADEILRRATIPLPELLDKAQRTLESFDGPVDAIIGFWDFPVSTMVPILCERLGLSWPSLESVLKCEHKYWSRLEQRRVIDEYPRFGLVDLDSEPALPEGMTYPVWLKPIKSASSELAYRVGDAAELREAVEAIRAGIRRVADPFGFVLGLLELPPELAEVGGRACLAEEQAVGKQVTLEGYSFRGDVRVYGIVDSITYPDSSSFLRYQYPSRLPGAVSDRMADISRRFIEHVGLDGVTFNIEYFWDPETDSITLLEVNPRHSQSHAKVFELVDGIANHHCMLQLALGREPRLPRGEGPYDMAAKWFLRHGSDAIVRRVPTIAEVEQVQRDVPGCTVEIVVHQGDRLSDLHNQNSYSYAIASIHVGGCDEAELTAKYERAVAGLPFELEAVDTGREEPTA